MPRRCGEWPRDRWLLRRALEYARTFGLPLIQQPGESARLYLRRQLCSLKCEAASKATPSEKGKLGWTPEARRMREGRW